MSGIVLKKILAQYDEQYDLYDVFNIKMHTLVENLLDENDISVHSVTFRVKDRDKLKEKIDKNEGKYSDLCDVTDISGIRIITYIADQVDEIAEIIQKEFVIDQENSVDSREIMESDKFGYLSLHYVVSLNEERANLTEYKKYKECKCEIQIRSILQHAWAEIEHDLGYKSKLEIPSQIRRRFTRIAGLLEVADSEFIDIKERLASYAETISQKIADVPEEVYIDRLSLESFINENTLIKEINQEISDKTGLQIKDVLPFHPSTYIEELHYLGIKTISELELKLSKNKDILTEWAVEWLMPKPEELEDMPHYIGRSIPLFYLNYCLVGQTGSIENIIEFLITARNRRHLASEDLAKEVIETYNKYKTKN